MHCRSSIYHAGSYYVYKQGWKGYDKEGEGRFDIGRSCLIGKAARLHMNRSDWYQSEINELKQDYEKQVFDLRQLLEISKSLSSTLDSNILIDSVLYTCMGQMQLLQAGLFSYKTIDSLDLSLHRSYKGFDVDHSRDYNIPSTHPLVSFLNANYSCYTIKELKKTFGPLEGLESLTDLNPSLVVPMRAKGRVNGIIVLGDRINGRGFNKKERDYLLNIAAIAAISIHNVYLFEMTTTDMMTKLKIRHFFTNSLNEKMATVLETDEPLSVIMIDIDHFKILNDTHGHTCGDIVLKNVANVISDNVRQIDIAARYGGEEFIVLLPQADLETANVVAERIRSQVESLTTAYSGRSLQVTVSLGIARFDSMRDLSADSLIERADKALYMSKEHGRNKVSLIE